MLVGKQILQKLDGNGFLGSDGWMPGDYGALESAWTMDGAAPVRALFAVLLLAL